MISNKRGLSEVVTTLIIILLVLVAIGIVWAVVSNILQTGSEQTEISAKCLQVGVKATAASCTAGACSVTYKRSAGGDDIDGVVIILSNGQDSVQKDVAGNLAVQQTRTETGITETLTPDPNSVEVAAYFTDASGNQQLCATIGTFEF
ncbi:MAG: archaellin/type IV pilin N-terminal domain-containing protein [Nanoarchaeota archaeon]